MSQRVFRFAPSPNGRLHLGHAYSALLNEKMARECGGKLLLRIEDIDTLRCTSELIRHALDDLAWLGISFDADVLKQSEHFVRYHAALDRLRGMGLLYPCICSRTDIKSKSAIGTDPEGQSLYPGTCHSKSVNTDQPVAWRLDMAKAVARVGGLTWDEQGQLITAAPTRWGDVVLGRKDIGVSYHIAVVIDDALQGVTDVVRGKDLYEATSIHRLLQVLLDLPEPRYHHHDLQRTDDGEKLSKSRGHRSLSDLRAAGVTAEEVRQRLFPLLKKEGLSRVCEANALVDGGAT